ncbi:MAG: Lrp/AsnC family transcriptional regulator [Candidatus Thorarchaeota archaeon]|nr:Lrp/AsnC family transcriptional regulator [Candidatus Thorarchaeota archaeon]
MDNKDKLLISILRDNGRTSLSDLGKELGMSHVAVSKRLEKLVSPQVDENGHKTPPIVRVTAGVNADTLQMKMLFMGLETENMEVTDRILKKYSDCPRLVMLAPVTGRYNLFAVMVAEDTFSLESILGTCSIRTESGIRRSETWFGNSPMAPEYINLDLSPSRGGKTASCGRDCGACKRFTSERCVGCPAGISYRGTIYASPLTEAKRGNKKE